MIHCSDYEWWRMAVDSQGCAGAAGKAYGDEATKTWRPRGSWRTCQANWMHLALFKFKGMQENFSSQVVIETFFFLRKLPMSVTNIRGIRLESLRWRMTGRSTQKCCVGISIGWAPSIGLSWTIRLSSTIPISKRQSLWPVIWLVVVSVNHCPSHGEWLPSRWPIPQREKKFLRHSVTRV